MMLHDSALYIIITILYFAIQGSMNTYI